MFASLKRSRILSHGVPSSNCKPHPELSIRKKSCCNKRVGWIKAAPGLSTAAGITRSVKGTNPSLPPQNMNGWHTPLARNLFFGNPDPDLLEVTATAGNKIFRSSNTWPMAVLNVKKWSRGNAVVCRCKTFAAHSAGFLVRVKKLPTDWPSSCVANMTISIHSIK